MRLNSSIYDKLHKAFRKKNRDTQHKSTSDSTCRRSPLWNTSSLGYPISSFYRWLISRSFCSLSRRCARLKGFSVVRDPRWRGARAPARRGAARGDEDRVAYCRGFFIGILIGQPIISYAERHKFITFKLAVKTNQLSEREPLTYRFKPWQKSQL